jgi:hypothetical protein
VRIDIEFAQLDKLEARVLLQLSVPKTARQFVIEALKAAGKDAFEIDSVHNKDVLGRSNRVAIAAARF